MHIDTEVQSLLQTTRVGMLATLGETLPLASAVPFVALDGWTDLLLHLSTLAAHTQNLLRDPRMSILLMEPDDAQKNPLALRRLSLQGAACRLDPNSPTYAALARRYLDRFPRTRAGRRAALHACRLSALAITTARRSIYCRIRPGLHG